MSELEESDGDIALNVTGGNKWMAIAAQEVFPQCAAKSRVLCGYQQRPCDVLDKTLLLMFCLNKLICAVIFELMVYDYKEPSQVQATGANDKLRELCQNGAKRR